MPKANNTNIYTQDPNLSMFDYLLGSNSNTANKKTSNYTLQSIFTLFYNYLGYNAFLNTTDTTTYPVGTPGCFYVYDENDIFTTSFDEARKITFSQFDTYNYDIVQYFELIINSGKFLFKLINLEDKDNFVFVKPSNFQLGITGTTFNVDIQLQAGLSNGSFVNYKRYLIVLEFAAGTFDPADYDLSDFTNTSGNPFVRQDALDLKLNISDYNDRFKGKYTSFFSLITTLPTASTGDYAIVDSGSGSDAIEYIYDEEEGWVQGNSVGASSTDALSEGSTNLYFTTARVLATVLSGLSLATGGEIVSTDSILIAFGKIQKQITDLTTTVDSKLPKDFSTLTSVTLPLVDTDLFAVVRGGVAYKIQKSDLSVQIYKTINTNTSLDNSYHNTVVWVTATCNITIPSGLRSDFNCTFRTLTGATATFLTSGTTISSESDGDVQAEKTMSYVAQYSTNTYIISGGGLS